MEKKISTKATSFNMRDVGLIGIYLFAFATCGWFILIANLFGFAGKIGWLVPKVDDISGLIASVLLLLVLALAPYSFRQIFKR